MIDRRAARRGPARTRRPAAKPRLAAGGAAAIGVVCLWLAATPGAAQPGGFDAEFTLSREASVVVLEYDREIGAIEESDPVPFLRVHGDGRYRVHYPRYMKLAGDWQGRIAPEEIDALVGAAIDGGLLEFDAGAVERRREGREAARRQARRAAARPELFEVSDKESTRIRLRLERYKPAGVVGAPGAPVDKEIVWWGLRDDARLYPEIDPLRKLADFESRLRALAEAPDLERLVEDP